MMARLFIALLLLITVAGCYHDNEEELAPCTANTDHLHFSDMVVLFNNYGCNGCHTGAAPEGGVSLAQYATVKTLVDNGRLLGAITHATGFAPMPQGGSKMSDCDISRVRAWIDAGAPDH